MFLCAEKNPLHRQQCCANVHVYSAVNVSFFIECFDGRSIAEDADVGLNLFNELPPAFPFNVFHVLSYLMLLSIQKIYRYASDSIQLKWEGNNEA